MADRDTQTLVLSRSTLLLVTGMGVGLLTLSYVLGVQVGKQSAALRRHTAKGSGEELQELPMPMEEQLKVFEELDRIQKTPTDLKPEARSEPKAEEAPKPDAKAETKVETKAETKTETKPETKGAEGRWTLQLVSTSDAAEAKRVAEKAKAAGFVTTTVKDKGQLKVRLSQPLPRKQADEATAKLQAKGIKPFALKTD